MRGDRWSKDEGQKSSFCLTDGHLSFEECRIGDKAPKIERSSCTPRRLRERWCWILCSIYRTRIISITNDSSKSHGYHVRIARMRRTRSRRSICLYPGEKWKMLTHYWKFQNRNVQTLRFVYHDRIGQKHGPIWKIQSSSWTKSVWSSFSRTVMGKVIWENPIEMRLGEGLQLGMSLCTSWKRTILICACGRHQIGWKETKSWSDVENTQQRSWFGRTKIIPWSCVPGMYSKTTWNKQRYCTQLQNHVWIQNLRRSNWKITTLGKSVYYFVVRWHEGHAKQCVERYCELANKTNQQLYSINSLHWRPFQRRRKIMLSDCPEMLILGACNHQVDQCMRQTLGTFDLLHSSHMWLKTVCHVGNTARNADWDCFKSPILQEILRIQNLHQVELCAFFGSHTFVLNSLMCKKQTSVSHSPTESEIISLDTRFRIDGKPALDFWDLIVAVPHGNTSQRN